ncbi:hypothetical protein AB0952_08635 [Streptomyces caniferus]|uniref:hypothetical protein n=1 Tax=Streptomyces caniferus TaxID=285557 RepID=UPI0034552DD1
MAAFLLHRGNAPRRAPTTRTTPLRLHPGWTAAVVLADVAMFASMARDATSLAAYGTSAGGCNAAAATLAWVIAHTATHHKASTPAPQPTDAG